MWGVPKRVTNRGGTLVAGIDVDNTGRPLEQSFSTDVEKSSVKRMNRVLPAVPAMIELYAILSIRCYP